MVLLLCACSSAQREGSTAGLAALQATQEKLGLGGGLIALSSAALWFPLAVLEFICELACSVGRKTGYCSPQGHYHHTLRKQPRVTEEKQLEKEMWKCLDLKRCSLMPRSRFCNDAVTAQNRALAAYTKWKLTDSGRWFYSLSWTINFRWYVATCLSLLHWIVSEHSKW